MLSEEQRQEREDWEALIESPGWQRFLAHCRDQWTGGEAFKRRVHGLREGVTESIAAMTAIEKVTAFPAERLEVLRRPRLFTPEGRP